MSLKFSRGWRRDTMEGSPRGASSSRDRQKETSCSLMSEGVRNVASSIVLIIIAIILTLTPLVTTGVYRRSSMNYNVVCPSSRETKNFPRTFQKAYLLHYTFPRKSCIHNINILTCNPHFTDSIITWLVEQARSKKKLD